METWARVLLDEAAGELAAEHGEASAPILTLRSAHPSFGVRVLTVDGVPASVRVDAAVPPGAVFYQPVPALVPRLDPLSARIR